MRLYNLAWWYLSAFIPTVNQRQDPIETHNNGAV